MSEDPTDKAPLPAATALPADFKLTDACALARDLAIGFFDEETALKKNGISLEQYENLKKIPYFQQIVEAATKDWNGTKNQQQRLALLTSVGIENLMPHLLARAQITHEPLTGIAQLLKVLVDIAGLNNQNKAAPVATEKFKITINLGADTEVVEKTRPLITVDPDGPDPNSLQAIQGSIRSLLTLQTEPEKT